MIKIALLAIVAVLIAIQFKTNKPEYSIYIGIVCCILIFYFGINRLEIILDAIKKVQGYINMNQKYLVILIKIIGITYISEFTAGICKDAGYSSISGQVELAGKLTILTISIPILLALLDTITKLLEIK